MKKLGNARALDTASLLGGLMRDHWVSMHIISSLLQLDLSFKSESHSKS